MNKTIQNLIGKEVTIILRTTAPTAVEGKLIECDDLFLVVERNKGVLERNKGEVVIPLTSILHLSISPVQAAKR